MCQGLLKTFSWPCALMQATQQPYPVCNYYPILHEEKLRHREGKSRAGVGGEGWRCLDCDSTMGLAHSRALRLTAKKHPSQPPTLSTRSHTHSLEMCGVEI